VALDPAATADGWLTRPLLEPGDCEQLLRAHDALLLPPDHAFYASSAHGSRALARDVDQMLKHELGPRLRRLLPDHEPFLAAFISKGSAHGSHVDFHQDWTYTDERVQRATILWIPLVDTTGANGALRAVPGSHRWATGLRASGGGHATASIQDRLAAASTEVPLSAGEAFVYDPALIHGSGRNHTDAVRPVAAVALAPKDAPLVHFHVDDTGHLSGWTISESHYTINAFGTRPVGCDPVEPWDRLVRTEDLVP
jgi:Phytanoyl-CoA dioxygenase (PhyH)